MTETSGSFFEISDEIDKEIIVSPRITLKHLAYFCAVAQNQSVAKAAEALNISSPSISMAITNLEEITNMQLFVRRHARGMVLTQAGKNLVIEARNILQKTQELEFNQRGPGAHMRGRINIGSLESFTPYLLPPLIRAFSEHYPKIQLQWHECNHESILNGLENGEFELGLMYDFEIPSSIIAEKIRDMPTQIVLSPDNPLCEKKDIALNQLADQPFILLDHPLTRDYYLSIFNRLNLTPKVAYRSHSFEMVRSLVAHGFGYSLLNFCPPHQIGTTGAVVGRPLRDDVEHPHLVLGRLYRYQLNEISRVFIEFSIDYMKKIDFGLLDELTALKK